MNYIGRAVTYLSGKARDITLATIAAATLASCQVPQAPVMGAKEQVDAYRQRAEDYNKDKVINPCEVAGIIQDLKSIKAFKANLKGSDSVTDAMKHELRGIEDKLTGYLDKTAQNKEAKVYVVYWVHRNPTNPNSSIRIFGLYKNDHMELQGTIKQIADALNVPVYDLEGRCGLLNNLQAGNAWGYKPETRLDSEEKKREISQSIMFVPAENREVVTQFFPGYKVDSKTKVPTEGEVKNKAGERITGQTYKHLLNNKEMPLVGLVAVLEPKEGEKPAK